MQEPLSENLDSTPTPEEVVVSVPEAVVATTPEEVVEPAQEAAVAETPEEVVEIPKVRKPKVGVRFPSSAKMFCFADNGLSLKAGEQVVVEGELGITIGSVAKAQFEPEDQEREPKPVLRRTTAEDIRQHAENEGYCLEARAFCNERITSRGLPMKLLLAEVTLDRKRLLFYFISESRIDFRELVKDLASKYRTRIELRQIGVRDAAKMVGGIGVCGLEYCCRTFLKGFAPISIKMAKQQDLVLNTVKLSGGCGRLLCCLQYEYDEDAVRAKRRPKNAPPVPMTEEIPAQGSKPAQPARPLKTRPPRPAPVPGAEPELTFHADFEYEPQFTTPQEPDVAVSPAPTTTTSGEQEDKQRRRRRRGRRKPEGTQQGGAQATAQGAGSGEAGGERRERPLDARPSRPQRPPMPQRPPRPEQERGQQSVSDGQQRPTEGERPATSPSGEAPAGGDEAQRARRRRRWRNKPKGGPSQ